MAERNEYGVITPFGSYLTHEIETAACLQQKHVYLRRLADETLKDAGTTAAKTADAENFTEAVMARMNPAFRKRLAAELLDVYIVAVVRERQRMRSIRGGT